MNNFFGSDSKSTNESKLDAQKIAFAPIVFQVSKAMRDFGILSTIAKSGEKGIELKKIIEDIDLSTYAIRVLLDAGIDIGIIRLQAGKYILTKTGYFILNDKITRTNMDFVNDVCYQGMFHLDKAIKEGKPSGLKVFGNWDTVYQALSSLPEKVQTSWFNFDHYFSDSAFPKALSIVFKDEPKKILDVGGNTGKWAIECAKYSEDVSITILDLPGQLEKAKNNIKKHGFEDRISGYPINLLDHSKPFPKGFDAIWMSQFLDCFSENDIIQLLKRAYEAMDENSVLYILETYVDRQRYEVATYCLNMTSLYFTCLANGNSRMYHSDDMIKYIKTANLHVEEDIDNVALSHTLFKCRKD
ncbi:MAG: methyltransferase [Spirochaetes bacterium]|nr:methyltransferase [Spirochaetota bacterium]